jgi:hypothetical protein
MPRTPTISTTSVRPLAVVRGIPILPPSCRPHPRAVVEELECNAVEQWLAKMERRAAKNNPDDNDRAL